MNPLRPILVAVSGALSFFREAMLAARIGAGSPVARRDDLFKAWRGRCTRYEINFALSQNDAFKVALHPWAQSFKAANGVSKGARHVFNPCYELAEFWVNHIWGGALDPDAGDGQAVATAIPFECKNARIRAAIAKVLLASNWQVNKDLATRYGAVLADCFLKVDDDPEAGTVRIEVIHPGEVVLSPRDAQGHVKSYQIRRWVDDPTKPPGPDGMPQQCLFTETCDRDGELVTYATFRDGKPYPWNGVAARWSEPYGFVPMVQIQHANIGLDYGLNAWQAGISRFLEVDDQASSLGDAIRRAHKAPMLMAGMDGPPRLDAPAEEDEERPRRGKNRATARLEAQARETMPFIYTDNELARPWALAATPDAAASLGYMQLILDRIDRMFPELIADAGLAGMVTAEAVRNARQLATDKVQQARIVYDAGLARVLQMALAIGGFRGYAGFEGFGLDSFAAGKLAFKVGTRDVFKADPRDELDDAAKFWAAAESATRSGYPLALYLADAGWAKDKVDAYLAEKARADAQAQAQALATAAATTTPDPGKGVAA